MRVLITGAGGYLGLHLARALADAGHSLKLLLRKKPQHHYLDDLSDAFVFGDILDPASLAKHIQGCDAVFHTAGMISYNPKKAEQMYQTNVVGTRNVAEACWQNGVKRLVYTSSSAAIGINVDRNRTMNEEFTFNARPMQMAYFDTKFDAEQEVWKFVKKGLDAVAVNPGSILGPHDVRRYENTYAGLIYRVNPPVLFHGGNAFVRIDDCVQGHLLAWEKGRVGERYILVSENVSFADLIRKVNDCIPRKSPKMYVPVWLMRFVAFIIRVLGWFKIDLHLTPELISKVCRWYLYLDSSKAQRELGFCPRPVQPVLCDTLIWLRELGRIRSE